MVISAAQVKSIAQKEFDVALELNKEILLINEILRHRWPLIKKRGVIWTQYFESVSDKTQDLYVLTTTFLTQLDKIMIEETKVMDGVRNQIIKIETNLKKGISQLKLIKNDNAQISVSKERLENCLSAFSKFNVQLEKYESRLVNEIQVCEQIEGHLNDMSRNKKSEKLISKAIKDMCKQFANEVSADLEMLASFRKDYQIIRTYAAKPKQDIDVGAGFVAASASATAVGLATGSVAVASGGEPIAWVLQGAAMIIAGASGFFGMNLFAMIDMDKNLNYYLTNVSKNYKLLEIIEKGAFSQLNNANAY